MSLSALAATLLAAAAPDVSVDTLRTIADRFDQAQIGQDRAAMEAMTAPDLVFVGSNGLRQTRAQLIDGWLEPGTTHAPFPVTARCFLPRGPASGVVGGDAVVRGTPGAQPFAARIRFADTFRRIGGQWRAVHIQATR